MKKLFFTIEGKAIAKQSVKFTKEGIKYTPSHIINYSNWVRLCFKNKYPEHKTDEFAGMSLRVNLTVYFEMPKSFSKIKQIKALEGDLRPIIKPDCDNISKNILDSLNGLCYADDKQIVSLTVNKFYASSPSVVVEIEPISEQQKAS